MTVARVTQQYIEAATAPAESPGARITQQYIEAAVTIIPETQEPGEHRYWRLYITANSNGSSYTGAAEIELLIEGVDQTGSGVASASAEQSGNPASAAVDDSASSFWGTYSQAVPQSWSYDFGSGVYRDIDSISIRARPDSYYYEAPRDFVVQYSDDGTTWIDKKSFAGETGWTSGEVRTFSLFTAPPGESSAQPVVFICT